MRVYSLKDRGLFSKCRTAGFTRINLSPPILHLQLRLNREEVRDQGHSSRDQRQISACTHFRPLDHKSVAQIQTPEGVSLHLSIVVRREIYVSCLIPLPRRPSTAAPPRTAVVPSPACTDLEHGLTKPSADTNYVWRKEQRII